MKVTQYFPVWQITVDGVVYSPAAPGETPVAITCLPAEETRRLLKMGAIRKVEYDDGIDDAAPEPSQKEAAAGASADSPSQKEPVKKETAKSAAKNAGVKSQSTETKTSAGKEAQPKPEAAVKT